MRQQASVRAFISHHYTAKIVTERQLKGNDMSLMCNENVHENRPKKLPEWACSR